MSSIPAKNNLHVWAGLVVAVSLFLLFATTSPVHAAAQTLQASAQTQQLLPPGQNICHAVSVSDIEPHLYGGVLESFDVTISDTSNSYVGILAQVGNTPLPLDYITRWAGTPNGLRIHVDTPDTPASGMVPVTLTLLSSPSGAPTCITTISFDVSGVGIAAPYTAPSAQQSSASVSPVQNSTAPSTGKGGASGSVMRPATSSAPSASTTSMVGAAVTPAASASFFDSVCSGYNAYRLWLILLVIYVVIVAIVVFAEPSFLENSVIGSTATILVPLILLLAFWYLSASCRAASWIPVVACVIAIAGLFLAFREYELPPLLPAPSKQ